MSEQTSPDVETPASELAVAVPQPELFSPDAFPPRPDLVQMVKAKSFIHSGVLSTRDEELCRNVCRDLLLGLSDRQIAKKWRISRSTIVVMEVAMRARGELEPLKQQLSNEVGEILLLGLRNYKDALVANMVNPAQLPIPMAALIDKKGQLDAGVVPGTNLREDDLDPEKLRAQFAAMKAAKVIDIATVEKQSTEQPTKTQ